jgi:hypothetical protein
MDEHAGDRIAGVLAIFAGACWVAWAVINASTHRGLEMAAVGSAASIANALLTVGWNVLLIPAALRLYRRCSNPRPPAVMGATIAGVLSLMLWAIGGVTHISHALETTYLSLAAVWLLVLGTTLARTKHWFAYFTMVVGVFTALDALFNIFEPVPFAVYLLAAPKLPLSALWSLAAGVVLIRHGAFDATPP